MDGWTMDLPLDPLAYADGGPALGKLKDVWSTAVLHCLPVSEEVRVNEENERTCTYLNP